MSPEGETFYGRLLDVARNRGCSCAPAELTMTDGVFGGIEKRPAGGGLDLLLMPPIANAHDHARGVRPISLGGFDLPLELWLAYMTNTPRVDPSLVVAAALGRQALGGVGTVMIHYTRPQDPSRIREELEVVAKAAETVGLRVAIAVAMRDRNPLGYGPDERLLADLEPAVRESVREKLTPEPDPPASLVGIVDDLADRINSPLVSVQYGPYGLEWCSDGLMRLIAEHSAISGRRVHMHLLESRIQREYLDCVFPQGPVRYLDEIGLLSSRLSVAHGVWLRPDEIELLAERGVTISVNSSSNLSLRSGMAPVQEMKRRGVPLAFGLDGFSVDDDDDAFREIRLNYLLHKGVALEEGVSISELLHASCYGGRHSVSGLAPSAGIVSGAPADLMVLDFGRISGDVIVDVDEASLLVHRGTSHILQRMFVAGREVVRNGELTGIDLVEIEAELDAQVRQSAEGFRSWQQVSKQWRGALRNFYSAGLHRCG